MPSSTPAGNVLPQSILAASRMATAPFIKPLLEVAEFSLANMSLTLRVGLAILRRLPWRAVRPRMDWTSLQRWSALHGNTS